MDVFASRLKVISVKTNGILVHAGRLYEDPHGCSWGHKGAARSFVVKHSPPDPPLLP